MSEPETDRLSRVARQAAAEAKRLGTASVVDARRVLGVVERHPLLSAALAGLVVGMVVGYFLIPHYH